MKWDLTGERINGLYMGLFPYVGTVQSSRVKYGGAVQHTVVIDELIQVYGDLRETILVDNVYPEVNRILPEQDDLWLGQSNLTNNPNSCYNSFTETNQGNHHEEIH